MAPRKSGRASSNATPDVFMHHGKQISFFVAIEPIGQGGFGDVWVVKSTEDDKLYAMKVELPTVRRQNLRFEAEVLRKIQSSKRFPQMKITGTEDGHCFMVEELLGPNLTVLVEKLPASVVLPPYLPRLADEMLFCIEEFHRFGFIHRDIKPQNFVLRLDGEIPLCLIDYGIARQYQSTTGQHIGAREVAGAVGSPVYASLSVHNGQDCSRRDDLISWFYSVLALSQHRLPWLGLDLPRDEVARQKTEYSLTRLARDLSGGFQAIAAHIEGLGFADAPDYRMMHEQLRRDMPAVGVPFEWMDVDTEGGISGGNWDPCGFLMKISPWLQPRPKGKCQIM